MNILNKTWDAPPALARATRGSAFLLFLIGCFSMTQIKLVGHLGISEFFMVAVAPFLFVVRYEMYRKGGVTTVLWLCLIWLANAILSDYCNHIPFPLMIRGIAVPIVVFSVITCLFPLLRKNPQNLRWLLLGLIISGVISTFIFQRGVAGDLAAERGSFSVDTDYVTEYKLFWVSMVGGWIALPIMGWYLSVPSFYAVSALIFMSVFNLVSGGRSAFALTVFSLILIFIGRKNEKGMKWIKKNWFIFILVLGVMAFAAKGIYKLAVLNGIMGEAEIGKYETQTKSGDSILKLLMTGRSGFFCGIYAALHHPFLGHGSHAIDTHGYALDYCAMIGDDDGYNYAMYCRQIGKLGEVSAHSHIITYWDWHGIGGLVFWLYVLFLLIKTLIRRLHVYPPWYGYLALALPGTFWNIFFSPFGGRVQLCALIIVALMLRTMEQGQRKGMMR